MMHVISTQSNGISSRRFPISEDLRRAAQRRHNVWEAIFAIIDDHSIVEAQRNGTQSAGRHRS